MRAIISDTHENGKDIEDQVQVVQKDKELELENRLKGEDDDFNGAKSLFSKGTDEEHDQVLVIVEREGISTQFT